MAPPRVNTLILTSLQLFLCVTVFPRLNRAQDSVYVANAEPYCPYFGNRAPVRQPELLNCTWYKEYSCCNQGEIDVLFGIKMPQGASDKCLQWIHYLMCWICSPRQHLFLRYEKLVVCEEFCQNIFMACENASLEETLIGVANTDGKGYCQDRKFLVKPFDSGACFNFDPLTEISRASLNEWKTSMTVISTIVSFTFFL